MLAQLIRGAGLAAGLALVGLVAAASSAADAAGRIAFASKEVLTLSAGKPEKVAVCAVGAGDVPLSLLVETVSAAAVTFTGPSGSPPPAAVAGGSCAELFVTAAETASPGEGTLVAVSPGAVARRQFVILPAAVSGATPLTPLHVTLQARHALFHGSSRLLSPTLPFGPYETGQRMDAGALVAPAGTLAVLEGGGETAYLVRAGAAPPADAHGIVQLPVRLVGAGKSGAYRGTFAFTDATGRRQDVSVTVAVGDSIWWCALAILLGVLSTLLAILLARRAWPTLKLLGFRKRLNGRYRRAIKAYNAAAAREEGLPRLVFDQGSAELYERHLGQAYDRYLRRHTLVDADSSEYAALQDLVDRADEDSEFVGDEDGLLAVLRDLRTAISQLERWRRPGGGTVDPRLLSRARTMLETRALGVGAATGLAADAGTYTALLGLWPRLLEQLVALEEWAAELQDRATTFPAWYQAKFGRALGDLARARDALFAAEAPEAFDDRRLLRYLDRANSTLYEVSAVLYSIARPEPAPQRQTLAAVADEVLRVQAHDRLDVPLAVRARWLGVPGRETVDRARRLVEPPPVAQAPAGLAYGDVGLAGSLLAILIAVGGALATGLTALYSPVFGSLADYLTAVALGAGGMAATRALVAAVANMRKPIGER